jgi:ribonuclease III
VSKKPTAKEARLAALEISLGHVFQDKALFQRALTHVSAIKNGVERTETYQRLEFLGDRVLGLVISHLLFETFPAADEGELSRRLADLVRKETCADVARRWEVGPCLFLGEGESMSGGRRKMAILGDACESLIGAVFIDGGYPAAERVVRAGFTPPLTRPADRLRDAKTMLQEWVQGRGFPTPVYREIGRSGPDHAPAFVVAAEVGGLGAAEGIGRSKRIAEQNAAEAFLAREGQWHGQQENTGHDA